MFDLVGKATVEKIRTGEGTDQMAGSDWVNPPLSTRPHDPDKFAGWGAKQWTAREIELSYGPPNRPNFFHADLPILLWNYLAVGDRVIMRWDSINSYEAGLQIYGGGYITARTVPPTFGTPIPCRACGGPTSAFGGDLYDCKNKKCGALTYAATNPGNPAWWPVTGSSFRQARVDRADRYAEQNRGGVVLGVDRG